MKRNRSALALAALALLLSACTATPPNAGSGVTDPGASTRSSEAAPTTSSETTTETTTERNARLATTAVVRFWGELDKLGSDPDTSLTDLAEYAGGQALTKWQRNLTLMRGEAVKQVGSVVVESPTATYDRKSKTYEVKACINVSKVNVVDKAGKSVVAASRQPRARYTYEVSQIDGKFYVVSESLQGNPC